MRRVQTRDRLLLPPPALMTSSHSKQMPLEGYVCDSWHELDESPFQRGSVEGLCPD